MEVLKSLFDRQEKGRRRSSQKGSTRGDSGPQQPRKSKTKSKRQENPEQAEQAASQALLLLSQNQPGKMTNDVRRASLTSCSENSSTGPAATPQLDTSPDLSEKKRAEKAHGNPRKKKGRKHKGEEPSKDVNDFVQAPLPSAEQNGASPILVDSPEAPVRKHRSKKRRRDATQLEAPQNQDDVPIDPELNRLEAAAGLPTYHISSGDQISCQPSTLRDGEEDSSRRGHKRRRTQADKNKKLIQEANEKFRHGDGNSDLPEDEPILGLEDEKHRMAKDLGTEYTEDTEVEDLRRQQKNKKSKASTRSNKRRNSMTRSPTNIHVFSENEIATLDRFRDNYCQINDMTHHQFNSIIQSNIRGNHRAINLFGEIQELFPHRTRSYVQRFCRRRYHNFHSRGVWKPEEDNALRLAVEQKGTSWKAVGEMLDRFAEDCRDRYRNYLIDSAQHRNRDAWNEIEVVHLSQALLDCTGMMRLDRYRRKQEKFGRDVPISDADSDQEKEDMKFVNWQIVSELMAKYGSSRSRLQCSFKWNKIRDEDRKRYLKDVAEARKGLGTLEVGNYTANNMKISTGWRLRRASKKVLNMRSGDKYDLLRAILDAGAASEDNIPWRFVGDEDLRHRWTATERRAAWLMMKKEIPDSHDMDWRHIVNQLLTLRLNEGIGEHWDPEMHGWIEGSEEKKRGNSQSQGRKRSRIGEKRQNLDEDFESDPENELGPAETPGPSGITPSITRQDFGEGGVQGTPARHTQESSDRSDVFGAEVKKQQRARNRSHRSPDSLFDDSTSPQHLRAPEAHMQRPRDVSPGLARRVLSLQDP